MMIVAIVVAQGVIFLFLILILRHFMKSNVTGAVDHLQKANEELMKKQSTLKLQIAESEKQYKEKMASLNQEIAEKQAGVRKEANETLEEARETAMKEREKLINEAVETREKMKKEIMAQMEENAILHAQTIIAEFFSGDLKTLMHESLIKDVIEGINSVDLSQFQINTDTVELIVAQPVSDKEKKAIQKSLESKIKKTIKFKEEKDANLVGGVILKFGTFVIDGSLSNHLKGAAARVKKATAKRYQKAI